MSRPKKVLVALMNATLLGECCTQMKCTNHSPVEKPKVKELQMDWLRSEDLKEEKSVTTPVIIIAVDYTLLAAFSLRNTTLRLRSQSSLASFGPGQSDGAVLDSAKFEDVLALDASVSGGQEFY